MKEVTQKKVKNVIFVAKSLVRMIYLNTMNRSMDFQQTILVQSLIALIGIKTLTRKK
jgi:hypothetical protein